MAVTETLLNNSPDAEGIYRVERYSIAITNTPTIAAGAAAGTAPTVAIAGTDVAGTISITTGTTALGSNGVLATITFGNAMAAAPDVILTPANAAAQALAEAVQAAVYDADTTTALFKVTAGASALADSTAYKWNYVVLNARVAKTITPRNLSNVIFIQSTIPCITAVGGATAVLGLIPASTSGFVTLYGNG